MNRFMLLIALLLSHALLRAQALDISKEIGRLPADVDRATIYLGPPAWAFVYSYPRTEADLPDIGCTYHIPKESIPELIRMLQAGQIMQDLARPRQIDARIGVYISTPNRLAAKLIFRNAFKDEGIRGIYNGTIYVTTGKNFEFELRSFAEKHEPSSIRQGCNNGWKILSLSK